MAKMYVRKNRKDEYRIDVRSLSYEEYKMLYALIVSSYARYSETGSEVKPLGSFDLRYLRPVVFADVSMLDSLEHLLKVFTKRSLQNEKKHLGSRS